MVTTVIRSRWAQQVFTTGTPSSGREHVDHVLTAFQRLPPHMSCRAAGSDRVWWGHARVVSEKEGWILLKLPRGDIDEVGEDEVTVMSGVTC